MAPQKILLLCVCLSTVCAVRGEVDNFGLIQAVTGRVMEKRVGDSKECPVRPWTEAQTEARERRTTVTFDEPFVGKPSVSVAFSQLDVTKTYNNRVHTSAEDVTETGFTLFIGTWCNTYMTSVRVDYQAVGLRVMPLVS